MKDKKCVQVIFDDNWKKVVNPQAESAPIFRSNLGDFPKEAVSVFERSNVITHWKPVVLLAKGNIFCNLSCNFPPYCVLFWLMIKSRFAIKI